MPFKLVPGRLDIQAEGVRFRLGDGATTVGCFVTHFALQDLGGHYLSGVNVTDLQAFTELLPEIEHLANAKFDSGRIEENGEVTIGTADLLRRPLRSPDARFDQARRDIPDRDIDDSLLESMISRLGRISRGHMRTPSPMRRWPLQA